MPRFQGDPRNEDLAKWQTIAALNIKLACTVYPCFFFFSKVDYPTFVLGTPNFGCLVFYSAPSRTCVMLWGKWQKAHRLRRFIVGTVGGPLGTVGNAGLLPVGAGVYEKHKRHPSHENELPLEWGYNLTTTGFTIQFIAGRSAWLRYLKHLKTSCAAGVHRGVTPWNTCVASSWGFLLHGTHNETHSHFPEI